MRISKEAFLSFVFVEFWLVKFHKLLLFVVIVKIYGNETCAPSKLICKPTCRDKPRIGTVPLDIHFFKIERDGTVKMKPNNKIHFVMMEISALQKQKKIKLYFKPSRDLGFLLWIQKRNDVLTLFGQWWANIRVQSSLPNFKRIRKTEVAIFIPLSLVPTRR